MISTLKSMPQNYGHGESTLKTDTLWRYVAVQDLSRFRKELTQKLKKEKIFKKSVTLQNVGF